MNRKKRIRFPVLVLTDQYERFGTLVLRHISEPIEKRGHTYVLVQTRWGLDPYAYIVLADVVDAIGKAGIPPEQWYAIRVEEGEIVVEGAITMQPGPGPGPHHLPFQLAVG